MDKTHVPRMPDGSRMWTHLYRDGELRMMCRQTPATLPKMWWTRTYHPGDPIADDVCPDCRRIAEGKGDE